MSSVNLIVLYPEDDGPVAEVVHLLREALRRAEAGEITGVALAMACHPRAEMSAIATRQGGVAALHLATSRMQQRLLSESDIND
tara:strand:- start:1333 stop:1584 length:252 start_codon:yes stop_codon:yes gene_type:complete